MLATLRELATARSRSNSPPIRVEVRVRVVVSFLKLASNVICTRGGEAQAPCCKVRVRVRIRIRIRVSVRAGAPLL